MRQQLSEEVLAQAASFNGTWKKTETIMIKASKKTCGRTKGGNDRERESWWWNNEVESMIKVQKAAYKVWQRSLLNINKLRYRQINNRSKKVVSEAKESAWRLWIEDLNTAAVQNNMFKKTKQTKKDQKDVLGTSFTRSANGNVAFDPKDVQDRWRVDFEDLLNIENPNILENTPAVLVPIEEVIVQEESLALRCMKSGKASGPSEVTSEMFVISGDQDTDILCSVFNNILKDDTSPEKWAESITVPLFKGKGDALNCGKYRGLRLLEHGVKIWERILMRKLEPYLSISPQQFGFAPGKSATDAILLPDSYKKSISRKRRNCSTSLWT